MMCSFQNDPINSFSCRQHAIWSLVYSKFSAQCNAYYTRNASLVAGMKVSTAYSEAQALAWHEQDLQWALSFLRMKLSSTSCTENMESYELRFSRM